MRGSPCDVPVVCICHSLQVRFPPYSPPNSPKQWCQMSNGAAEAADDLTLTGRAIAATRCQLSRSTVQKRVNHLGFFAGFAVSLPTLPACSIVASRPHRIQRLHCLPKKTPIRNWTGPPMYSKLYQTSNWECTFNPRLPYSDKVLRATPDFIGIYRVAYTRPFLWLFYLYLQLNQPQNFASPAIAPRTRWVWRVSVSAWGGKGWGGLR